MSAHKVCMAEGRRTFCIPFDHCMVKVNHIASFVVGNMLSKDHVLIEVPGIEDACWEPDLFDVRIDVVLAFDELRIKTVPRQLGH